MLIDPPDTIRSQTRCVTDTLPPRGDCPSSKASFIVSETVIDPRLYDAVILYLDEAVAAGAGESAATLISELARAGVGTGTVASRATATCELVTVRVDSITTKAPEALHTPPIGVR